MASSVSSSHSTWQAGGRIPIISCRCGHMLQPRMCRNTRNAGRRYYICPNYQTPIACSFFDWYDPEISESARSIIAGLLNNTNEHEREKAKDKKKIEELELKNLELLNKVDELHVEVAKYKEKSEKIVFFYKLLGGIGLVAMLMAFLQWIDNKGSFNSFLQLK